MDDVEITSDPSDYSDYLSNDDTEITSDSSNYSDVATANKKVTFTTYCTLRDENNEETFVRMNDIETDEIEEQLKISQQESISCQEEEKTDRKNHNLSAIEMLLNDNDTNQLSMSSKYHYNEYDDISKEEKTDKDTQENMEQIEQIGNEIIDENECDICGDKLILNQQRNTHKCHIRINGKQYKQCCTKLVPLKTNEMIESEMDTDDEILTKENKWYQCKTCKQRFKTLTDITQHEFGHNGFSAYKCRKCSRCFIFHIVWLHHMDSCVDK